jgi:hypothetical protein
MNPPLRRNKAAVIVALVMIGLCVGGLGVAAVLWNAEPTYWEQSRQIINTSAPQKLREMAEQAEYRVLPEWSAPIGMSDGVRTISVSFDEANAWLAMRLNDYLRNQGASKPQGVGDVIVTGRDGALVVAFDYDTPRLQQIVSVFLRFTAMRPGEPESFLVIDSVTAGRLPLPMEQLAQMFVDPQDPTTDPGMQALMDHVIAGRPVGPIILPVDDQREAILQSVSVRDDGVDVAVKVQRKSQVTP